MGTFVRVSLISLGAVEVCTLSTCFSTLSSLFVQYEAFEPDFDVSC